MQRPRFRNQFLGLTVGVGRTVPLGRKVTDEEWERLVEVVGVTEQAIALQRAYLDAGIVGPMRFADALHVAVATVSECRAIVSWNFKRIVNFRKVPLYNWVNAARGYATIAIHSPQEVVFDEEEDI